MNKLKRLLRFFSTTTLDLGAGLVLGMILMGSFAKENYDDVDRQHKQVLAQPIQNIKGHAPNPTPEVKPTFLIPVDATNKIEILKRLKVGDRVEIVEGTKKAETVVQSKAAPKPKPSSSTEPITTTKQLIDGVIKGLKKAQEIEKKKDTQ